MSQQLAPKTDRPPISLSLTQPHSKQQQKSRSGTPLAKSLSDDAPLGESRRASTPTKPKVLKVVLLDEHKAREKAAKSHKNSTDNGVDGGGKSPEAAAAAAVKNGSDATNGKKSTNGTSAKPKVDDVILIEDDSPKKPMRESPRQKNTPTRQEAKDEEKKKTGTPDTSSSTSAKAKSPRNVEKEKEAEEVGKLMGTPPATPPKKVEKKSEATTPAAKPTASAAKVSKKASKDLASDSLLQEPSFKGFEDDEMESLMVEMVSELDSPMPPKSLVGKSPGGKVLRLSAGPPNRARISPFRRVSDRTAATQQNASTIVNLSTVSEQSLEAKSFTSSPAVGMPAESSFGHSMRVISGRRTVRPINEICLTAYRNLNDSASSMNATVGSEINNDSFRTPIVSVIGRKRFQNDSPDHPYGSTERIEKEMATDSPKRARFDFNGLMDFVASPVTMLRNRLSRAKLQSTPKCAAKMMEDDDEKLEIPSLDTSEIEKVAPVEGEGGEKKEEGDEDKQAASEEAKSDGDVDMKCDEAVTNIVGGEEEIVVTEISASKRRNCSIM